MNWNKNNSYKHLRVCFGLRLAPFVKISLKLRTYISHTRVDSHMLGVKPKRPRCQDEIFASKEEFVDREDEQPTIVSACVHPTVNSCQVGIGMGWRVGEMTGSQSIGCPALEVVF